MTARRVLLALAGAAVALLVAEALLRALAIRPERCAPPRWLTWDGASYQDLGLWGNGRNKRTSPFVSDGVVMGEYVPGAKFKVVYASDPRGYFDADHSITFTINALGMRGPQTTRAKPAGQFRVLGIGDSFTFGTGVHERDTYLSQLEQLLQAHDHSGRHAVLNAGVMGYNTRDEVLYLERRWLDLDPDLVLIGFYLNDAYDDVAFANMGEDLALTLEPTGLARASYVIDILQHAWRAHALKLALDQRYRSVYFQQPRRYLERSDTDMDWLVARRSLEHAVALAREHHFAIALVLFPELRDLDGDYPFRAIHELVLDAAAQIGLPALDLLATFRGHPDRELWVHPSDHHPNEIAHRLAALQIERFLRQHELCGE
ncbi:MAG: SGNH/GDSL hydrolase family protein [Planctomycetota bacterium]